MTTVHRWHLVLLNVVSMITAPLALGLVLRRGEVVPRRSPADINRCADVNASAIRTP
jgi:hypothetical protein